MGIPPQFYWPVSRFFLEPIPKQFNVFCITVGDELPGVGVIECAVVVSVLERKRLSGRHHSCLDKTGLEHMSCRVQISQSDSAAQPECFSHSGHISFEGFKMADKVDQELPLFVQDIF